MYHIFCISSAVELLSELLPVSGCYAYGCYELVEHVFLLHVGASSGYRPRSSIAGSLGSTLPNFLKN
jgi:hypothetical protein